MAMQGVDPTAVVGRYIEECWNHGRLGLLEELVSDDFVDHFPFDDNLPDGRDGLMATIRLIRAGISDLHCVIEDMIAEDDRVVVRYRIRGTHDGQLAGHAPTLRQVMINGMVIYRVEDHQIVDQWSLFDTVGLMKQLRVVERIAAVRS
jgi:steroid delta-isomerase-like uncharacterized protein